MCTAKLIENVVLLIFTLYCNVTTTAFQLKYKCHKLLSLRQPWNMNILR